MNFAGFRTEAPSIGDSLHSGLPLPVRRAVLRASILEVGMKLLEARQQVKPGDWSLWLDVRGIPREAARRYMRTALAAGRRAER